MNTVGIRATAYCLNFAPELALHYGGTPAQERRSGRDPGFLQALEAQAQTYGQAQAYAPNKTYIGAMSIDELQAAPRPWTEHPCEPARFGKFGEIMPEDELLGLMDICDVFDLIWLEEGFAAQVAQRLARDPVLGPEQLGRLERAIRRRRSRIWWSSIRPCRSTMKAGSWAAAVVPMTRTRTCPPASCWRTWPARPAACWPCSIC